MVMRERERVREEVLHDRSIAFSRAERERSSFGKVVVRRDECPWAPSRHAKSRPYLLAARAMREPSEAALDDWNAIVEEIATCSGKQRQQGGAIMFILQGSGHTLLDDERLDWEAGDLLVLPLREGGHACQHFNDTPGGPARWILLSNQGVDDWSGSALREIEPGPHDQSPGGSLQRGGPPGGLERLYVHAERQRETATYGKVVVRGKEEPWGLSRQALIKRYLWTSRVIQVPVEATLDDWRVFVQDVRAHSGKHRHQGGLVIYVLEGEGYTIVEGERYDWEAGDLLLLPIKPGGVEHQHFNREDGKPAKWIAFINSSLFSWGASELVQIAAHPEFHEDDRRGPRVATRS